ncbi:MAG: trypsin-like peptidase domain-containing protein [Planctomycetota bacterium]
MKQGTRVGIGVLTWGLLSVGFVASPLPSRGEQPAPVTKEGSAAFRTVVKQTLPAVVSISSITKVDPALAQRREAELKRFEQLFGPLSAEQRERFAEESAESAGGFGSGVIVREDGIILTNNHVVEGADLVKIRLNDDRIVESNQIFRDPKTDLAIIKLKPEDAKNLTTAKLGDSDKAEIGDWVLAMGSPFGLNGTVTAGIISAKGRQPTELNHLLYKDFIQTDAQINPGNSGGPIVNLDGEVVGINTAIRSSTGEFSGVAFSIPSNMAKEVISELIEHGRVRRGYLGIRMADASEIDLKKLNLDHGVMIDGVIPGQSPASRAGLRPRDVILSVNDKEIKSSRQLQEMVMRTRAGQIVQMKVHRPEQGIVDVPVTIDEQPENFGGITVRRGPELPGPQQTEVEAIVIDKIGVAITKDPLDGQEGLLIVKVEKGSLAEKAGLEKGMTVLAAEKKPVTSGITFAEIVEQADLTKNGLILQVLLPQGNKMIVVVKEE